MSYEYEKRILPEFPRTKHLPLEPNASSDDKVASVPEMKDFLQLTVEVTEKIDGANSGMAWLDEGPIIRNRSHVLNKAYAQRKTPAQQQFSAAWTFAYDARERFAELQKLLGFLPSVYGEWLFARHATVYEAVPSWFVAYDVYDSDRGVFIAPEIARAALLEAGFDVVPQLAVGRFTEKDLLALRDGPSDFGGQREGIYMKGSKDGLLHGRYKMVGPHFATNPNWNKEALVKNKLRKS